MVKQDVQLAVNCGSSSIKFTLFTEKRQVILTGQANNVQGDSSASYSYQFSPEFVKSTTEQDSYDLSEKREQELDAKTTYEDVFEEILKDVTSQEVLGDNGKERIKLIAHRIVHGGTADGPIVIRHGDKEEKEVLDRMEEVSSFAPLHVRRSFPGYLPWRSTPHPFSENAEPPCHVDCQDVPSYASELTLDPLLRHTLSPNDPELPPDVRHLDSSSQDSSTAPQVWLPRLVLRLDPAPNRSTPRQTHFRGQHCRRTPRKWRIVLFDPRRGERGHDDGSHAVGGLAGRNEERNDRPESHLPPHP